MSQGRAAVVLQSTKQRIGIDLIAQAYAAARAVFRELGSVFTVELKWSLEGVFPSRAVFSWAARQSHNPPRKLLEYHR